MRTALHILTLLIAAVAQLAATTVTGTLTDAFGVALNNCRMTITWRSFVTAGGALVVGGALQADIVNGALSVNLQPNEGSDPAGTSYNVSFRGAAPQLTTGCRSSETWVVPAAGPVDVAAVRVSIAPTATYLLNLNQISTIGADAGEVITFDGAAVAWDAVAVLVLTHPTDCTAVSASGAGELCLQLNVGRLFAYDGSNWKAVGSGGTGELLTTEE